MTMNKLTMKNNKEAIYLAYFEATEELEQLKKQLKPKASLCDITKVINHNLKDEVLSNNIRNIVAFVVSYLIYLYVSGEFAKHKLTYAIKTIEGLFPEPPSLFPVTIKSNENY